jgi:hypothetical protein
MASWRPVLPTLPQHRVEDSYGLLGSVAADADALRDVQVLLHVVTPVQVQGVGKVLDVHDVWVGAVVGLVRGGVGASADPAALVAAIDACPEVDGTVDPDDADLVELAFEVVVPSWEAVGAVDADRRLTELGAWGLPRALARAWGGDLHAT